MTGVFNVKKLAIWYAIAPTYGATTMIIMNMLPWTAQIRFHCLAHWHATGLTPTTGMIDPPLEIIATPDILTMITEIDDFPHLYKTASNCYYGNMNHNLPRMKPQ